MVRHVIIAAWRNMEANKLISAIAILGLGVGIAASRLELTFGATAAALARLGEP